MCTNVYIHVYVCCVCAQKPNFMFSNKKNKVLVFLC